jgi:hypothetical protein
MRHYLSAALSIPCLWLACGSPPQPAEPALDADPPAQSPPAPPAEPPPAPPEPAPDAGPAGAADAGGGKIVVGTDACKTDADCAPSQCCHATTCGARAKAPDCSSAICTRECRGGTIDCGGGCLCQDGRCAARMMP